MWCKVLMFQPIYHVSVSPTDGNGPTQGQRKTLTRVGFEPTTFEFDHRCSTDWATRPAPVWPYLPINRWASIFGKQCLDSKACQPHELSCFRSFPSDTGRANGWNLIYACNLMVVILSTWWIIKFSSSFVWCTVLVTSFSCASQKTSGPFLERPGNLSDPKSNSWNYDPLAVKSCSFNMFRFRYKERQNNCQVSKLETCSYCMKI